MCELADFLEMNPVGKGQKVSRLEHLFRIAATNGPFLGIASELLESQPRSAACFAQLPYSTVTKSRRMVRPGTSRLFELHFYPTVIEIQDDGSQKLVDPENRSTDVKGIPCTQVIGVVKYWGMRGKWYNAYTRMVTATGPREGVFVPTEKSWLDRNQPLNAEAFENDLRKRLLLDYREAIRRALPRDLANEYDTLLSYFIIPWSGRVAFGGLPVPTIRHIQVKQPSNESPRPESMEPESQSVFLSYGGPDERIAEALRAELTKNGIDTWWFPSDAQWGEKIHQEVRRNTKKYDRLLLLCSRRSLIRSGVLHEIEEVLDREADEGGKAIAIPVALDEVLDEDWWKFEPGPLDEPVKGDIDPIELSRRRNLATALSRRVAGDLEGAVPGDEKWNRACSRVDTTG